MPFDQQSPSLGASAHLVLDAHAELAEGPLWDVDRQVLWWVDITAGRVHRFDPGSGSDTITEIGRAVGCVALCEDGRLVIAASDALLTLDPETGAIETLATFEPDSVARRCNDGKPDPQGRLWIDRLAFDRAPGASSLVRFCPSGPGPNSEFALETILRGLTIPNGLDWTASGKLMYFVDSPRRVISVFDFDPATGSIANGRPFARVDESLGLPASGVPDGLTVDAEDCVWAAVWGGGCVLRFAPDGSLLGRIDVPVAQVSSCAFGGADMADLYITTAWEDATPAQRALEPAAGGIFRARPGVRGRPAERFRQGA
jgi:sugar lactone lactonase YvrE